LTLTTNQDLFLPQLYIKWGWKVHPTRRRQTSSSWTHTKQSNYIRSVKDC